MKRVWEEIDGERDEQKWCTYWIDTWNSPNIKNTKIKRNRNVIKVLLYGLYAKHVVSEHNGKVDDYNMTPVKS